MKHADYKMLGIILGLLVSVLISGCSMSPRRFYGGGTVGTGLGYGAADTVKPLSSKVSYFDATGFVLSSSRQPLPGVTIEAQTSKDTTRTQTTSDGSFTLPLIATQGEGIVFQFVREGRTSKHIIPSCPAGITAAFFEFIVSSDGTAQATKSEFSTD